MIDVPQEPPKYEVGQLVRHRRYGYRGVIVDYDLECQAPARWYQSNQTQPLRQQPWYHVLVDGTGTATYAAQDNLLPDESGERVTHPLLDAYFTGLQEGRYIRNDHPWSGWE